MRTIALVVTVVLAAAQWSLAGCGAADADLAELRMATYNAGLAPGDVDYVSERAPVVVAALADLPVALLCVQEFWREQDWVALTDASAERFPNTVRLPAEPVEALCAVTEFEPLQDCVEQSCAAGAAGAELVDCAVLSCGLELGGLSAGCTDCLLNGIGTGGDIDQLRADCLGSGEAGMIEAFIYDGAYDTGLLSALPIIAHDSLILDSYLVRAAVNYALVATALGEVHVFCTHLASEIPLFPYRGDHGSWKGEQARQIEQLVAYIAQQTAGSGRVLVLGDLNAGPAIEAANVAAEWPENYETLGVSGLDNPYPDQTDAACTSCPECTFHSADSDGTLIDHILLQRVAGSATVERILTEPVTIQVAGDDVETHLSDHFGLLMTLEGEARRPAPD